jgi:hypothetical protein
MHRTSLLLASALVVLLTITAHRLGADEGMWPVNRFPVAPLQEKYGFTPTPQWLEHAQLSSVRLAGGCSASFVSDAGLVMTNYHCVTACVEALSAKDKNLLAHGFYARDRVAERQCPGMEVNQLTAITDVTDRVAAATRGKDGEAFRDARNAVFASIERECATGDDVRCDVVTLYRGGKYDLYKYRRFQDVRMTFVPEFDTGFFGGDPDNFNFPRWNLDLAFLRVYEGGQPIASPHFFRWSPAGAQEGDLVFVTGHPGTTSRLFTVAQLEFERDVRLPTNLLYVSEQRGLLTEFQRRGAEEARVAASRLVSLENTIKVLRGRFAALTDRALMERKAGEQQELRRAAAGHGQLGPQVAGAWDAIAQAVERRRELWPRSAALGRLNGSALFAQAQTLVRLAAEAPRPNEQRLPEFTDAALPGVRQRVLADRPYLADLEIVLLAHALTHVREQLGLDDPAVQALLGRRSPEEVAREAVRGTRLADPAFRRMLMEGGQAVVDTATDPLVVLARAVDPFARQARERVEKDVESIVDRNMELVAQARFVTEGDRVYPDATFTLRVSYGTVRGWMEGDREVPPFTTIAGLYDRHTGSAPFNLPARWLERKAQVALDTPFNFVADTDIIGGNSGSPMIDRDGRIVGLVFDGNIHSLGGEYWFDPTKNRTVSVDSRGIREALRSVYGAERLLGELDGASSN